MQKRKLLLSLVALCSIVGMGITSCNNEPVQGPQGEQGPVGPQGPAGENGENGEDGSLILTGEGKPADTLGKDTDVYIDSTTGDLYQKENGSWTLVMNIKGEDGEDGHDGSNGSNGSDGQDGKTAYSNTVLPTTNGVIIPSIGSGIPGEDSVTFTYVPDENYTLEQTSIISQEDTITLKNGDEGLKVNGDGSFSYTTTMVEGGFVVSATFKSVSNVTVGGDSSTTGLNTTAENNDQIVNITGDGTEISNVSEISYASNDAQITLTNLDVLASADGSKKIVVSGDNNTITIDSTTTLSGFSLEISGKNNTVIIEEGGKTSFTSISIAGEGTTISGSYANSGEETSVTEPSTYDCLGTVTVSANDVTLNGVSLEGRLKVGTETILDLFTMKNCYYKANGEEKSNAYIPLNVKEVHIEDNIFNATNAVYNLLEFGNVNAKFDIKSGSTIKNNTFDMNGARHNAINAYCFEQGELDFSGNIFKNIDMANTNPVRLSNYTKDGDTITEGSIKINLSNSEVEISGYSQTEPYNSYVLLQSDTDTEHIEEFNLLFNNVIFKDESGSRVLTNSEPVDASRESEKCVYIKDVFYTYGTTNLPIYTIDDTTNYSVNIMDYTDSYGGTNGTVIPSKLTAKVGEEIVINVTCDDKYYLTSFKVFNNNEEVDLASCVTLNDDGTYSIKLTMLEGGLRVEPKISRGTNAQNMINYFEDGTFYYGGIVDAFGNLVSKGYDFGKLFESGDGSKEKPLVIINENQLSNLKNPTYANAGAIYFELGANIVTEDYLNLSNRTNTYLDLNGYTLTLTTRQAEDRADYNSIVKDDSSLLIENGEIVYNGFSRETAAFQVSNNASLSFNNVKLTTNGVGITAFGTNSKIDLNGSIIVSDKHAISTNNQETQNATVSITNSKLISYEGSGVLCNVPSDFTITDSKIYGKGQAVFARGGNLTLENCDLYLAPNDDSNDTYETSDWSSGNSAPQAFIVVGDRWTDGRTTSYDADKNLTLTNVRFYQEAELVDAENVEDLLTRMEEVPTDSEGSETVECYKIYAYLTSDEEIKASIILDELTNSRINTGEGTTEYYNNGKVSFDTL